MKKACFTFCLLTLSSLFSFAQVKVKMTEVNGVYTTPCIVNGLKLNFIFDTGASKVSISLSEALFMLKNGYLENSDLKGISYSQLANGQIVENSSIILREIEIGGLKLENVEAIIIHDLSAPLLLGQSVIQQLGAIELDGDILIIKQGNSSVFSLENDLKACSFLEKAEKYYTEQNYYMVVKEYTNAISASPDINEILTCWQLFKFGSSYYLIDEYEKAIEILSQYEDDCANFLLFYTLSACHSNLNNYSKSVYYTKRALYYANTDSDRNDCYLNLMYANYQLDDFVNAAINSEKVIAYRLNEKEITEEEIIKRKVKDEKLASYYSVAAWSNYFMYNKENFRRYLILSAICGNENSADVCKFRGFTY